MIKGFLLLIGLCCFKKELIASIKLIQFSRLQLLILMCWQILLVIACAIGDGLVVLLSWNLNTTAATQVVFTQMTQAMPWMAFVLSAVVSPILEEVVAVR